MKDCPNQCAIISIVKQILFTIHECHIHSEFKNVSRSWDTDMILAIAEAARKAATCSYEDDRPDLVPRIIARMTTHASESVRQNISAAALSESGVDAVLVGGVFDTDGFELGGAMAKKATVESVHF